MIAIGLLSAPNVASANAHWLRHSVPLAARPTPLLGIRFEAPEPVRY
jgi:hypothetical protein